MAAIEVTTQKQLDDALKARKPGDWIVCMGGTWARPLVADGNASVEAYGNASVRADGNASVEAYGNASVRAYGNASVRAYGNASVRAGAAVPVQKYPGFRGTIAGGVIIEVPDLTKFTAAEWCAHYGLEVSRGKVVVFKAVDEDFATVRSRAAGIFYTPGVKVEALDWNREPCCGFGLHACAKPWLSERYNRGAKRYVRLVARVADLVVIADGDGDKVKAPSFTVGCEVDVDGDPVSSSAVGVSGEVREAAREKAS